MAQDERLYRHPAPRPSSCSLGREEVVRVNGTWQLYESLYEQALKTFLHNLVFLLPYPPAFPSIPSCAFNTFLQNLF